MVCSAPIMSPQETKAQKMAHPPVVVIFFRGETKMKLSFTFAIGLVLTAVVHGQSGREQAAKKPPKEVLQEFVKMELGGARLSAEGRRKTARFFVQSSGLSQDGKILVLSDDYEFHDKAVSE